MPSAAGNGSYQQEVPRPVARGTRWGARPQHRYDARMYEISTADGHLIAQMPIPLKPHGMCVWPQPGRYSLGHTGNMR